MTSRQTRWAGASRQDRLARAAKVYIHAIEVLAILSMVTLTVVAGLQVYFRYVVGASLFWSEEVLRYTVIWTAFLVAGLAYTRGEMIGMRLAVDKLPPRPRRIADALSRFGMVVLLSVVAWYGLEFAQRTAAARATALQISMFWVHLAVPIGNALLALHVLAGLFVDTKAAQAEEPRS